MQTKQKWALTLTMALSAVSCGGSTELSDPYMGVIDGTGLESKFQPATCGTGSSAPKCYQPMSGAAEGTSFPFYNLGVLASSDKSLTKDGAKLVMPITLAKTSTYGFSESCKTGKEYDERTDSYREDAQYTLFDALPLTTSTAPVLPLVKVKTWSGVSQYTCNAIKDASSLTEGKFGGSATEGESLAVRAIIDVTATFKSLSDTSTFAPQPGWFSGLQFVYLDGGAVPTEEVTVGTGDAAKTVQAVKMMDGVWLKPTTSGAKPTDANAKLVFQAKPGDANWSPVVRLREFTPAAGVTYTSLCYQSPDCVAGSVDMTKATTDNSVLFIVSSAQ
ncbi:hypothetical protein NR798_02815 [Archangium gephyra]|uniref:hypothetical protein n=1 Tax=Archangium gephyra TaxID=48 RepID=UPI0035D42F09